jgi:hypothetical protein
MTLSFLHILLSSLPAISSTNLDVFVHLQVAVNVFILIPIHLDRSNMQEAPLFLEDGVQTGANVK